MMEMRAGGHLYLQTNENQNQVIHYVRGEDGTLTELGRALMAERMRHKQRPWTFRGGRPVAFGPSRA